jgi:hypothetical protein
VKNSKQVADQVTRLWLPGGNPDNASLEELEVLIAYYDLANQARKSFLNGEITLDEYCQLLEKYEINVDNYLQTLEVNLDTLKLL